MPEGMLTEEDLKNMSPEEIAELQRKNCIFCKIIREEIPAKKVYEDDQMVAILDINPASKGHTLVMPKEHYPLLPLLPWNLFNHIFTQTQKLAKAVKEAVLAPGVTIFIANGAAAGQQSPHFLFHLIPRENATDIEALNLPKQGWPGLEKTLPILKTQLRTLLKPYLIRAGKLKTTPTYTTPKPPVTAQTAKEAAAPAIHEQTIPTTKPYVGEIQEKVKPKDPFDPANLAETLDNNAELRRMITQHPEEIIQFMKTNPDLARLFKGINIHKLSQKLAEYDQSLTKQSNQEEAKTARPKTDLDKISQLFT